MGNRLVASLLRGFLFPLVVFFGEELVYVFGAFFDRVLRDALQRGVKRGVDAEIFSGELQLGIFIEQVILHHVDEVRRFAAGDCGAHDFQRDALGVLDVSFGDVFVIEHLRQDAVACLIAAFWVAVGGGVIVGRADDACEVGVFGERELAEIFSEVGDAGFGESADAKAAAIAEVNLVGIELEDLLLVEALLQLHSDHQLGELAAPGALVAEEERARDLHRDGARALIVVARVAQIGPRGADDANEVEAAMLEIAFVFGGNDRVDERRRNIVVANGTAFFAKRIEKVSYEFGLDVRGLEIVAAAERLNGADLFAAETDGDRIGGVEIGKPRRDDVDAGAAQRELAERVVVFFGAVADLRQVGREFFGGPGFPVGDALRSGENLRGVLQQVAGQARIDHPRILDVEVRDDADPSEKNGERHAQDGQTDPRGPEALFNADAQTCPSNGWTFIVS